MGSFHSSLLSDPSKYATRTTQEQAPSPDGTKAYGYIVVGGGAAGCVLASRLSEDPQTSVLLLEAGQSHEGNFLSRIPLAWPQLLTTTVNWAYETVAQTHAKDRKLRIDRGKVLGGSTTINALIYQHCAPEDFEEWVRMGAHGWGYEDMRPYLLKSETWTQHAEHPDIVELDHGTSGPWKTRFSAAPPIHKALLQACHSAGLGEIPEFNARAGPKGSSTFTSSIDEKGQRHSVANAYLTPAVLARPNLTVAINAHVEKILLTTDDASGQPRATGVQLSQTPNGPTYHAMAKREVILSAGVISTPQILMLSGLGPREELVKHDIRTVLELPQLGKNYYDHISSGPVVFRAKPSDTLDYLNNPLSALYAVAQWSIWGTGPMSGLAAPGAAFFNVSDPDLRDLVSSKASANADVVDHAAGAGVPDIEMPWFPIVVTSFDSKPPPGVHGFTLAPVLLKPESSGSVSLRSANAYDKPLIDPNYLSTPNDIAVLVRAVRLAMRVGKRAALETREPEKGSVFWLGDADSDAVTDEEITEYMREHCLSAFHPTSTARISETPATGVVDAHLRVHGVAGLRICDASVFPSVPTGHPVALVVAVAERAADLIRAEARSGSGVAA